MFVRVAFAAAMSVDPDILIVDEALAVGDAKFQHKCFDRFAAFQQQGKTIIFVSHNANLVSNHCNRVMLLDSGKLVSDGEPVRVVNEYMELLFGHKSNNGKRDSNRLQVDALSPEEPENDTLDCFMAQDYTSGDSFCLRSGYNSGEIRITGKRFGEIIDYIIATDYHTNINILPAGDQIRLLIKVRFQVPVDHPVVGFSVKTVDGIELYGTNTYLLGIDVKNALANEVRIFQFTFRSLFIPGDYFIDLGVAEVDGTPGGSVIDVRRSVVHVAIVGETIAFTGLVDVSPKFADLCRK
jgi:lipopolysaccharide transport system ATP-binding protein